MKFTGKIVQQTAWAVLFLHRSRRLWLPKAQIKVQPGPRGGVRVSLPRWLARCRGLAA